MKGNVGAGRQRIIGGSDHAKQGPRSQVSAGPGQHPAQERGGGQMIRWECTARSLSRQVPYVMERGAVDIDA